MNTERFQTDTGKPWNSNNGSNKNVYTGLLLLIIGGLLLADRSGVNFPFWFFSWPVLLIGIGIFSGLRHNFKKGPWLVLIIIGVVFLADKISDDLFLRPYFWPIVFIAAGIYVMTGGFGMKHKRRFDDTDASTENSQYDPAVKDTPYTQTPFNSIYNEPGDVVDITAIFSGVKKNVLSRNFRGGDVVAIMGGAEINLTKADCTGKIKLDTFTMFGGTKLIVPPDWDVQSNVVAIFGGVDDKRPPTSFQDLSKVVFLEGTCIFGGIEIKSF